jgi:pentatricopeptide repeat protein
MSEEAPGTFSHMLNLGIKPDHVIFTSILSACSHAGRIDEGLKIFDSIEKIHSMKPTMEQYACMVDLLARGGRIHMIYLLSQATEIFEYENINVIVTLLSYPKHTHIPLLFPNNHSTHVLSF